MLKVGTAALAAGGAAMLTGGVGEAASAATGTKSPRTTRSAPIPDQEKPLPMGPDGYRLDRIGPEVYAVTAAPGVQAGFVVSSAGVIVVDAPLRSRRRCVADVSDQHAHIEAPEGHGVAAGDLIALGPSHPCTTFDEWRVIHLVDDNYTVVDPVRTWF